MRALRAAKHTQRELAEATGCTPAWISALERGRHTPSLAMAQAIAAALGCTLDELVGDQPWAA